ncbi:MAG: helix-turn-helix transcriptional regulator [Planctomycetes bacterium]|nr:helix-turn-helix transcriptional regulator [Planctomycetota bacterium]
MAKAPIGKLARHAGAWRNAISTTSIGVDSRHSQEFRIDRPTGSGDWVLIHFPTSMRLRDRHGIRRTQANACIIYGPNDAHWYQTADRILVNHYVHLNGTDLSELISQLELPVNEVFYPKPADFIHRQLEEMRHEWSSSEPHAALVFSALAVRLLAFLSRRLTPDGDIASPRQRPVIERLHWFRKRIKTDPNHPWTVSGLARLAELSPSHFSTVWHRLFGVSPREELIQARLARACKLLVDSPTSVADVAQQCGFSDPLYFSRLFRKRIGINPSAYAKNQH